MSLPSVNYNEILSGTISLSNIQQAFRFYNSTGDDEWNITGIPKTQTHFINTDNLNESKETSQNYMNQLSSHVFGSSDASTFFSNSGTMRERWESAADNILFTLNSTTANGDASKDLIDGLLSTENSRFYLKYNASVTGATTGTYTGLTATGSISSATCTVKTIISNSTTIGSINMETVNGLFTINENIVITNGGGDGVDVTITNINSVQLAILNGTLNSSFVPTTAPMEVGDIIKLHYIVNSNDTQLSASGNEVSMAQTFFVNYTVI